MMEYYEQLLSDNGLIEIRDFRQYRHFSYFCRSIEQIIDALETAEGDSVYSSIQKPFANFTPECGRWVVSKGNCLRNANVQEFTRLAFDFDPRRDEGCNSSNGELRQAHKAALKLTSLLAGLGFPHPIVAQSGNGYHVYYRCLFVVDDLFIRSLSIIYEILDMTLSNEHCSFDSTVKSPAQIMRVYDGLHKNKKCPAKPDRPQRLPQLINYQQTGLVTQSNFDALWQWSTNQIKVLKLKPKLYSRNNSHTSGLSKLDIVGWFESLGLYSHHVEENKHAVQCPWAHEHSSTNRNDCIIFEAIDNNAAGFYCHHDSCKGRTIKDVLQLLPDSDLFGGESC